MRMAPSAPERGRRRRKSRLAASKRAKIERPRRRLRRWGRSWGTARCIGCLRECSQRLYHLRRERESPYGDSSAARRTIRLFAVRRGGGRSLVEEDRPDWQDSWLPEASAALQEASGDAGMQGLQVGGGEEVDGLELAVDGGLAADLGADGEVGAE